MSPGGILPVDKSVKKKEQSLENRDSVLGEL